MLYSRYHYGYCQMYLRFARIPKSKNYPKPVFNDFTGFLSIKEVHEIVESAKQAWG